MPEFVFVSPAAAPLTSARSQRCWSEILDTWVYKLYRCVCVFLFFFNENYNARGAFNVYIKSQFAWKTQSSIIYSNKNSLQLGGMIHDNWIHCILQIHNCPAISHTGIFFFIHKHKLLSDSIILITSMPKLCHSFAPLECS